MHVLAITRCVLNCDTVTPHHFMEVEIPSNDELCCSLSVLHTQLYRNKVVKLGYSTHSLAVEIHSDDVSFILEHLSSSSRGSFYLCDICVVLCYDDSTTSTTVSISSD